MVKMIFSETTTIFMEPDLVVPVPQRMISDSTTVSSTEKIVTAAWKIISVLEKTVSLTNLILDAAQMPGSHSLKIGDELGMIVFMKGKTTGAERRL